MIIQVSCCITRVVTERTDEWLLCTVDCYVVLECFCLVGLVFTMSAMKLENSCMGVLAVQHLVEPHVTISTLVTPSKT